MPPRGYVSPRVSTFATHSSEDSGACFNDQKMSYSKKSHYYSLITAFQVPTFSMLQL